MSEGWTDLFFWFLNTALFLALLVWFVRRTLIPMIRYHVQARQHVNVQLEEEITTSVRELASAEYALAVQEHEVARLTMCMEQWTGVLAKRALSAQEENHDLFEQYKKRRAEDECMRVLEKVHVLASRQALSQARVELQQFYARKDIQQQYMDSICSNLSGESRHGER